MVVDGYITNVEYRIFNGKKTKGVNVNVITITSVKLKKKERKPNRFGFILAFK